VVNSRDKGKRGELMARDVIRKYWYAPRCERAGQTSGDVSADVVRALPKSHVEVKYLKSIAAFRFHGQALRDAEQDELPLVMMRETGVDSWLLMFDARRAEDFVARFLRQMFLTCGPEAADRFVQDSLHG